MLYSVIKKRNSHITTFSENVLSGILKGHWSDGWIFNVCFYTTHRYKIIYAFVYIYRPEDKLIIRETR